MDGQYISSEMGTQRTDEAFYLSLQGYVGVCYEIGTLECTNGEQRPGPSCSKRR